MLRTILFFLVATMASTPAKTAVNNSVHNLMLGESFYVSDVKQNDREIVFIDTDIAEYDSLISNLRNGLEVFVLDAEHDSVSQITAVLQQKSNVSALHIITHGRDGEILFANGKLNTANLPVYSSAISSWSNSFTENADILFYGCNVAEGETGKLFLHALAVITGADITASVNITGNSKHGGDWLLEHRSGEVNNRIALTEKGVAQYQDILPPDPPPSISSAHIGGDGSRLIIVYDEPLNQASVPVVGAYTVNSVALGAVTVNSVSINAFNTVTLSLASTIAMTDTVTVDYDNTTGATHVEDLTANLASSLTTQAVSVGTIFLGSSEWTSIAPSGGSQFDYFVDQQTGQGDGDIVGDGGSNPGFQVHFDDNGSASNTDGTLSFRFRLAEEGSNYYMVGIDADLDGDIDVYIRSDTTNSPDVEIVANGGGANISPSTSNLGGVISTAFIPVVNSVAVTDIDGAVVVADIDGAGDPDFYVNASLPFAELVSALSGLGITLTDTDPLRYAVATSVNGSTFNQDIAGLPKDYDTDATYVSSGAFSDPVNMDGSIAPVQPGTPVINDLAGDTLSYVMNDAVSIIDQSTIVTIADSDDTSLDDAGLLDGSMRVEIVSGADVTEDVLGITEGVVNGVNVTLSAGYTVNSIVSVGGIAIGTITDIGAGTDVDLDPEISFTVTFNQLVGNATLANVSTLIQAVTYVNTNIASSTEGVRTVSFLLSDGSFNTEVSTSVSVTQVADMTAPLAPTVDLLPASDSGVSSTDNITNDTTPTIRVTLDQTGSVATNAIVGDVVKLFEGAGQVGTATLIAGDISNGYVDITSSALTAGSLSFTATVTDTASNASGASGAQAVTLDTASPVIVLLGSNPLTIERGLGYFDVGATATDNIDGNITASIVTVNSVDPDTAGTYSVTYDVSDVAGNAAVQVARTVIVEDTVAPGVSILNQPASVNNLNAFTVTFQFTEIVNGFDSSDVTFTNSTLSNFVNVGGVDDTYSADITPTGAGNISIGVNANVAQDPSANNNTAAVTVITTFDNAPPVLAITGMPDVNIANQSAVVISGTCEVGDGDVSVFLTIGALPMFTTTACVPGDTWSTSFDLSTVTDGTNHIDIGAQQTDGAGNIGSAPFVMISKDTVRPNVQIQNVPGFVNANEFIVTFAFDEAVTGFDSSDISVINGVVNVASFNTVDAQTYTVGVSADGVGDVTLAVSSTVAQDLLGNTNNAATPVVAVYDITAPVVSITAPVTVNAANDDSYIVAGNCDTGDGDVTVSIVGATPSTQGVTCTAGSWTATFDVSAIADGSNALSIDASQTDAAGNTGNANVQADKDVLISVPTVNVLVTNSATPVISGTADDATSNEVVIAGASYTVTATAGDVWSLDTAVVIPDSGTFSLLDGSNEVVVTSTDSAGNSDVDISSNEVTLTLDDDNDGIPNSVECPSGPPFDNSCRDTDGDGIPDYLEVDSDNDGIPDASEAGLDGNNPIDSDGDGTPDYRDADSDNDGVDDSLEGVVDTDGDGIPDYLDIGSGNDSDGDGIPDNVECPVFPTDCPDSDGDSSPDYLETDSDNDGIDDAVEAGVDPEVPIDTDGDGTPDYRDTDSDADGTDDAVEGLVDNDNDGIPDYVDVITTGPGAGDSDGDGIADDIECALYPLCADSDANGTPDYMETDSDNDGIPDTVETGTAINDADNDGIDDSLDVDITGGLDLDNDGIDDRLPLDTDGDGTPDYRDADSDNDGIDDVIEGVIDTDLDGIPDYLDASNGDASGTDITGSGDSDGDGISDASECLTGLPCSDVDQDGKPDYMDSNPDDGPGADFDGDGRLNYLDPDDDNDRIPDVVEDPDFDADNNPLTNPLDSDLDGTPDYLDLDSDNDGLSDEVESGASGNDHDNDNIVDHFDIDITGGVDVNTDGIDDAAIQLLLDGDGDNLPDYLDVVFDGDRDAADTDKDGIPDSVECPVYPTDCPDSDADGAPDFLETDADGDGIDDRDEVGTLAPGILLDTDGDGTPDYRDTDSDNDGVDDAVEGLSSDADSDGIPDALDADSSGAAFGGDSDGDGVADMDECMNYPGCTDSDNDGTPDYMDADVNPYAADAVINTGLNGVGSNGPWSLLLIVTAFVLRRKVFYKS